MTVDLNLLERWQTGWSLSRGAPLPTRDGGGLVVEVGLPDQLRRHVFVDAGGALQDCAARIRAPFVLQKAAVDIDQMRRALPAARHIQSQGYLMARPAPALPVAPPTGYRATVEREHGAHVIRFTAADGQPAASGRVVLNGACAVFDRIETLEPHRRKGLGTALMSALDALAAQAGASERLLVATEAGRALYLTLGWQVVAPYSTAVLATQSVADL
jgi:GNAT superfamily N-acetyltransferase